MTDFEHISIHGRPRDLSEVLDEKITSETQAEIRLAESAPQLLSIMQTIRATALDGELPAALACRRIADLAEIAIHLSVRA